MATFPLVLLDPEAIEGATSISDKAIARALNETRDAVNELAIRVSALGIPVPTPVPTPEPSPEPVPVPSPGPVAVINIGPVQEQHLAALAVGARFDLVGPNLTFHCLVSG